jgi:hypothetical protein
MSTGCLAKHIKACLYDDKNRRDCKNCGVRVFDANKISFCSRSCAAVFNNQMREARAPKLMKSFTCLGCGKKRDRRKNSQGRFCDNKCQAAHRWSETRQRIEQGNMVGIGLLSLKRFITETRGPNCSECDQPPWWNGKPLTLEMDHEDGDRANNHPLNLRLLCPHCHTQTPTWGKKKRL